MIIPPNPILGKQRKGQQNQKAQAFSLIIAAEEGESVGKGLRESQKLLSQVT